VADQERAANTPKSGGDAATEQQWWQVEICAAAAGA